MATEAALVHYEGSLVKKNEIQTPRLYPVEFLFLMDDSELWILSRHADCLSVRRLKAKKTGGSVEELSEVTNLYIFGADIKFLLNTTSSRLHCQFADELKVLPATLAEAPQIFSTCGYLQVIGGAGPFVRILDLVIGKNGGQVKMPDSIGELPELTQLYISHGGALSTLVFLRRTRTSLGSLMSLFRLFTIFEHSIDFKSLPDNYLSRRLLIIPKNIGYASGPGPARRHATSDDESTPIPTSWQRSPLPFNYPQVGEESDYDSSIEGILFDPDSFIRQNSLTDIFPDESSQQGNEQCENPHKVDQQRKKGTSSERIESQFPRLRHLGAAELVGGSPSNGGIYAVGESSSREVCNLQNQDTEIVTLENRDCVVDGLAAKTSFNLHKDNCLIESNQQGFQNEQNITINLENEPRNPPCDSINPVHGEQDKNPQSVKRKKTQKKDISKESILHCMSQKMTLQATADKLGVSRSSMKRRSKELNINWLENRKRWQHKDAKNKGHNMKSPSERNSSQLRLLDPINSACHDHRAEHVDGSCSTFDVKADYKGDIVRIYKFSLSSGIEQLKEEVGKKLGLEVGKFNMKFLDEYNDWILMSCVSDLEHALGLSKSSGSDVVKLLVILREN